MKIWLLQICGDIHSGNYEDAGTWTSKESAEFQAKDVRNKLGHGQGLRLITLEASVFTWLKLKLMGR